MINWKFWKKKKDVPPETNFEIDNTEQLNQMCNFWKNNDGTFKTEWYLWKIHFFFKSGRELILDVECISDNAIKVANMLFSSPTFNGVYFKDIHKFYCSNISQVEYYTLELLESEPIERNV